MEDHAVDCGAAADQVADENWNLPIVETGLRDGSDVVHVAGINPRPGPAVQYFTLRASVS